MQTPSDKIASIDQYIHGFPEHVQAILSELRSSIRLAAPESDVDASEQEIARLTKCLADHNKVLDDFKKDKRDFLVSYVNDQVHGSDWRSKM